ncbi:GNAT family N-acetyltransferase [Geodermatophilus sp. SYSU D01106]
MRSVGEVRVLADDEWDALVARLGGLDTYTRAAYQRASVLLEPPGSRPVLLHYRDPDGDVALPLLLRPLEGGRGWDAASAYGYGGPVARGARSIPAFGAALDTWARANGVVTTFLRMHPVLGNDALVPPGARVLDVGSTVAWDVTPGRDLAEGMHAHHRRATRRADRAGLEITVVSRPSSLEEFRRVYEETMRRQQAERFFYFPTQYWEALLADGAVLQPLLVEGRLDGELVAALLCFVHGTWLHYHLGGSTDEGRSIGASNRCFLAAAQWAQSRGTTGFHLGGGLGGRADSPLFVFKRRYDPTSAPRAFRIAKLVHDPETYAELAGTTSTDGFFPPWRRP